MKILYFNLNYGLNGIDGICDFIQQNIEKTDVFCFQEIAGDVESAIDRTLPNYNSKNCQKRTKDGVKTDLKIYINNRFKNYQFETETFKNTRFSPIAMLNIKENGNQWNIMNYHGRHLPGTKLDTSLRLKMSDLIIKMSGNYSGKIIIGGDFNLLPDTKSITMFENNGYTNLIKQYSIDTTRNENAWYLYPDDKQFYADYVFVSKNCKVKNFKVPKNLISDHLPMIVELTD